MTRTQMCQRNNSNSATNEIAFCTALLTAFLAFGGHCWAVFPPNYRLIDVPDPNGCYHDPASANYGYAISPNSQFVVGRGEDVCIGGPTSDRGLRRDLTCTASTCLVNLGLLYGFGQSSESRAVLSTGVSVGWGDRLVNEALVKRPAIFAPGVFTPKDIGSLDGFFTTHAIAWDIDASKNIVGESTTGQGDLRATYWTETSSGSNTWTTTNLGVLSGDSASSAQGKNSSHNIVGWSKDSSGVPRAVIWFYSSGSWTISQLPQISQATSSFAHDINDSNTVVGWAEPINGERHAIRWQYSNNQWTTTDLGALGGTLSEAYSVNNAGDIVGKARTGSTPATERAFLWSSGTMHNLAALACHNVVDITNTATWTLREAWDINNDGAITGWGVRTTTSPAGTNDKAVVLVPIACAGDLDGSGLVDVDDLLLVINNWGETTCQPADATNNLVVDVDDLLVVINDWECPLPLEAREAPPHDVMECIDRYSAHPNRMEACIEAILRTGN